MSSVETEISLKEEFISSLCTFEVSKKAKMAGATCANTYLAYDDTGEITDGGYLEKIGCAGYYPAISLPFAILMLDDTDIEVDTIRFIKNDEGYIFSANNKSFKSENIVDVLVLAWIEFKFEIK
jgi:hypothetical protein